MREYAFLSEFWSRQEILFSDAEKRLLEETTFAVLGLGANGGPCAEAMVRLGAQKLILVDHDSVEFSNLNRQPYGYMDEGLKKADCMVRRLRSISPFIDLESNNEGFTLENSEELLERADVVIDAMDDYRMKVCLSRLSVPLRIPVVHTAGAGFRGTVTTFFPDGPTYEQLFGLPSIGKKLNKVSDEQFRRHRKKVAEVVGKGMYPPHWIEKMDATNAFWPTAAPACWVSAMIASMEAVKIACGHLALVIRAPELLQFDILQGHFSRFILRPSGPSSSYVGLSETRDQMNSGNRDGS